MNHQNYSRHGSDKNRYSDDYSKHYTQSRDENPNKSKFSDYPNRTHNGEEDSRNLPYLKNSNSSRSHQYSERERSPRNSAENFERRHGHDYIYRDNYKFKRQNYEPPRSNGQSNRKFHDKDYEDTNSTRTDYASRHKDIKTQNFDRQEDSSWDHSKPSNFKSHKSSYNTSAHDYNDHRSSVEKADSDSHSFQRTNSYERRDRGKDVNYRRSEGFRTNKDKFYKSEGESSWDGEAKNKSYYHKEDKWDTDLKSDIHSSNDQTAYNGNRRDYKSKNYDEPHENYPKGDNDYQTKTSYYQRSNYAREQNWNNKSTYNNDYIDRDRFVGHYKRDDKYDVKVDRDVINKDRVETKDTLPEEKKLENKEVSIQKVESDGGWGVNIETASNKDKNKSIATPFEEGNKNNHFERSKTQVGWGSARGEGTQQNDVQMSKEGSKNESEWDMPSLARNKSESDQGTSNLSRQSSNWDNSGQPKYHNVNMTNVPKPYYSNTNPNMNNFSNNQYMQSNPSYNNYRPNYNNNNYYQRNYYGDRAANETIDMSQNSNYNQNPYPSSYPIQQNQAYSSTNQYKNNNYGNNYGYQQRRYPAPQQFNKPFQNNNQLNNSSNFNYPPGKTFYNANPNHQGNVFPFTNNMNLNSEELQPGTSQTFNSNNLTRTPSNFSENDPRANILVRKDLREIQKFEEEPTSPRLDDFRIENSTLATIISKKSLDNEKISIRLLKEPLTESNVEKQKKHFSSLFNAERYEGDPFNFSQIKHYFIEENKLSEQRISKERLIKSGQAEIQLLNKKRFGECQQRAALGEKIGKLSIENNLLKIRHNKLKEKIDEIFLAFY